jgi:hypothetical protein
MSSIVKPLIAAFVADAAIAKGQAVKIGSDSQHVAKVSAVTDESIGVAQSVASAAGDVIEVALPGGGAKCLAKTTIAAGDLLGHNADASLQKVDAANSRIIAVALEGAVAGDLFSAMVQVAQATQAQS